MKLWESKDQSGFYGLVTFLFGVLFLSMGLNNVYIKVIGIIISFGASLFYIKRVFTKDKSKVSGGKDE